MTDHPDPPPLPSMARAADEHTTLVEMLEYYRAVLLRKAWGVSDGELATAVAPSDLTLGGLLLHMAIVEDGWFDFQFLGNDNRPEWDAIPWADDPDWELHNAHLRTGAELIETYQGAISRSRAAMAQAESLDQLSARVRAADGQPWNLRWIVVHMIEEYARHCGHADYIRQTIDGATGD